MVGGLLVFVDSIMEEQISGALLGVPSSQQAMIMMLQLMNMVSLLGDLIFLWPWPICASAFLPIKVYGVSFFLKESCL